MEALALGNLRYKYSFDQNDMQQASDEWGCNCGPSALAFALQKSLESVRRSIPQFEHRGYTSPSMMKAALANLDAGFVPVRNPTASGSDMFDDAIALTRIQWTGPWTAEGANPKWAYRQTHWIATWRDNLKGGIIFDCNGGIQEYREWVQEIVPLLTASYPRADGGWFPTHIWRLTNA